MKEEPAIDGVEPERVIPEAKEDKEAMRRLLASVWLYQLLNLVSSRVSRRFKVDADELWHFLFERIRDKLYTVSNPKNIPWADRLKRWSYTVAKNHAKNLIRHRGVEERHCDDVAHENTARLTDGKRTASLRSPAPSQESTVLRKEQDAFRPAILRATREAFRSLTPRDAWLVSLWVGGMTLQKISDITGIPLATVGNRLKVFQKTVVKAIMRSIDEEARVVQLLAAVNQHSEGIRQLLASSLVETEPRGGGPRAGV